MSDRELYAALKQAATAEDFICAVADSALPEEQPVETEERLARERAIIEKARQLQRPIDSDIVALLDALCKIRNLGARAAHAGEIAAEAIRQHNRRSGTSTGGDHG